MCLDNPEAIVTVAGGENVANSKANADNFRGVNITAPCVDRGLTSSINDRGCVDTIGVVTQSDRAVARADKDSICAV